MAEGGIGDPYILPIGGESFSFSGVAGSHYLAIADGGFSVAFRVADVVTLPGRQYIDLVVAGPVVVGPGSATIAGEEVAFDAPAIDRDGVEVRSWTGAGGERRVDVSAGAWKVAVIRDDGDPARHAGSPLDGVPHLAFFIDARPDEGLSGLIVDGSADADPARYLVSDA